MSAIPGIPKAKSDLRVAFHFCSTLEDALDMQTRTDIFAALTAQLCEDCRQPRGVLVGHQARLDVWLRL